MDSEGRFDHGIVELEAPERISVGLAIADRTALRHVRRLTLQMASIDLVEPEEADVVVTDASEPASGPCLRIGSPQSTPDVDNVIDMRSGAGVLEAAIRLVARGYRIRAPVGSGAVGAADAAADAATSVAVPLTPRERDVLEELATGASNKSIARNLDISPATAKFHVSAVITKLGARNRTDAVAIGVRLGLLLL